MTPKIIIDEHTITIERNGIQTPLAPAQFASVKTEIAQALSEVDSYFTGGAIKALPEEGEIEGYLIVWGNETQRDKQGEFFTPQTELRLDYYKSRPVLFHHGLSEADSIKIGEIYDIQVDNYGVKAKARLYLNHENNFVRRYARFAWEETKANKMFWSSGSIAHLVEVTPTGQITKWPLVEGSLTPTPAEPYRTKVDAIKEAIKSAYQQFQLAQADAPKEDSPKEDSEAIQPLVTDKKKKFYRTYKRKAVKMIDQAAIDALTQAGFNPQQILDIIGVMSAVEASEEAGEPVDSNGMMADTPTPQDQQNQDTQDQQQPPFRSAAPLVDKGEQNAIAKALVAQSGQISDIMKQLKTMMTAPPTGQIPGKTSQNKDIGPTPRKRSKWASLDWQDMIFVKSLLDGAHRAKHNGARWIPSDPKDFALELTDRLQHDSDTRFDEPAIKAIKAMAAIKNDEVNYSTLTSYGDEFVPDLWRSELWMTPRLDNPVFAQMQVIEMPSNPYNIPVEGSDITVFSVAETKNEAQLGINDSSAAIPDTQVGTSNTTITAGKLAARIPISAELVEDSIIPVAQHWRFKAVRAMEDARDFVILSADSTTGTSNINNSGGSISSTHRALYGGGDGLLHLPLVDNTNNGTNMGGASPTLASIRDMRGQLDTQILADFGNLVYFCDPLTSLALASLDEALNFQINGDSSSFNTGMVGRLDSIPVYVTNQMSLALSTGFVSSTAASNTLGRLLLVHKTSWYVGFRRDISSNMAYDPNTDAWSLVVSMRMGIARRSTDVSALLYNIAV